MSLAISAWYFKSLVLTLHRIRLLEEIILDAFNSGRIQLWRRLIDHGGKVLEDQFARGVRELLLKQHQIMATATTDIDHERSVGVRACSIDDVLLDLEPVAPVKSVCSLALHEVVEPGHGIGVVAQPEEAVLLDVVGVLKRGVHRVLGVTVVDGFEIFRGLLEDGVEFTEPEG